MSLVVVKSNGVTNHYTPVGEYTKLQITTGAYDFLTVVDTRFVGELSKFTWCSHSGRSCFVAFLGKWEVVPQLKHAGKCLLMHRYIATLAEIPNPKNENHVEHIDRVIIDNRAENLRWSASNIRKKRPREDDDLSKYVSWKIESPTRMFFRIEGHPAQQKGKTWTSTKATTMTRDEKYQKMKEKLEELDEVFRNTDEGRLRQRLLQGLDTVLGSA
jgi:hypothetical protein